MGMMGQNLTFLVGPDVSAAFFAAKDEELSQPEVYGFMKPVFGSNVVYDAPPKVRAFRKRAPLQALLPLPTRNAPCPNPQTGAQAADGTDDHRAGDVADEELRPEDCAGDGVVPRGEVGR
jgi:hypothetical protein